MKFKFESWFQKIGCKPQNKTKKGYIIPPSKELMQNWIISSFEQIDAHIIQKSFKICGINQQLDGSADNLLQKNIFDSEKINSTVNDIIQLTKEEDCDYQDIIKIIEKNQNDITNQIENYQVELAKKILQKQTNENQDIQDGNDEEQALYNEHENEEELQFSDIEKEENIVNEALRKILIKNDRQQVQTIIILQYL
ncbi:hypothetical protein ABPG72_010028 [Tetrahymena utriculariae]